MLHYLEVSSYNNFFRYTLRQNRQNRFEDRRFIVSCGNVVSDEKRKKKTEKIKKAKQKEGQRAPEAQTLHSQPD